MDDRSYKSNTIVQTGSITGMFWFIGWLFTIGFAKLIWWQGLLAVIFWPYYLGVALN